MFAVGGRVLGLFEVLALGVAVLCSVVVGFLSVWARPKPVVSVSRRLRPPAVVVGEECRVELSVGNDGPRPSGTLLVTDRVTAGRRRVALWCAPIPAGGRRVGHYRLPGDARGRAALGPLEVTRTDLFGFARRTLARGAVDELTVLPHTIGIEAPGPVADRSRVADSHNVKAEHDQGNDEFIGLRPYVAGDDLRRIHWASSARVDDLLIRETASEAESVARLVLDDRPTSHTPASFELALEIAASILLAAAGAIPIQITMLSAPNSVAVGSGDGSGDGDGAGDGDRILRSVDSIVDAVTLIARLDGPAQLDSNTAGSKPAVAEAQNAMRVNQSELRAGQAKPLRLADGTVVVTGPNSPLDADVDASQCVLVIADPGGAQAHGVQSLDEFAARWPSINHRHAVLSA